MTSRKSMVMLAALLACACDSTTTTTNKIPAVPTSPTVPTPTPQAVPTLTAIRLGIAGNAPATLEPGQTRQLWALATYSDGSETDLTNRVLWQTSNPVVATVSTGGMVTAAGFGAAAISASADEKAGTLPLTVNPRTGCRITLSPSRLVFGAFGASSTYVTVAADPSDCRWTAASDASWLPFKYDPGRSGSGGFYYDLSANSSPNARSANIIVSASGGVTAVHAVEQERPRSCSYVVVPATSQFTRAGGTTTFRVDTTPNDCRWTAYLSPYEGTIVSGQSGTGDGAVTFSVPPRTYSTYGSVAIRGLSGENPAGVHTFVIP